MSYSESLRANFKAGTIRIKAAYRHYISFRPTRLASSLSYYGLFALVPVLAIAFWVGTYIVRAATIGTDILYRVSYVIGPESTDFIRTTFTNVTASHFTPIAAIIASIALVLLAEGGANELKQCLDDIWQSPKRKPTLKRIVLRFLLSLLCVVLIGVAFVVFNVFANFLGQGVFNGTNIAFLKQLALFAAPAVLFILGYGGTLVAWIVLPDRKPPTRALLGGAALTALLLTLGNLGVTWYLSHLASLSTYGVAGSIVALLLWLYYSSLIFLFGASFTWTYMSHE